MATYGNNKNAEISNTRDSFFVEGEKKFFEYLMKFEEEREIHWNLKKMSSYYLWKKAKTLIDGVEAGEYDDDEMEVVEYKIAHYLGAIEDMAKYMEM